MPTGSLVHVVVPDAVHDPMRPSGGNAYDRRVCDLLPDAGWRMREHAVPDAWPRLGAAGRQALARLAPRIPDGALVLVDGLIAEAGAQVLVPLARRARLVVLVHSVPEQPTAADVLGAARAVIATSGWVRDQLRHGRPLPPCTVRVAEPGVDEADVAMGTPSGGSLLCVGAVTRTKGHDLLVAALTEIADLDWSCACVGSLEIDPGFVDRLQADVRRFGLADRVRFTGPRVGPALDTTYAEADLLVSASRAESYAMVVTEALARGLPVLAADVGGVSEALGRAGGERPGVLVAADDPIALAKELRRWLDDGPHRSRLRQTAAARRRALGRWDRTSALVSGVLTEVAS
jgi:glycosyltransferase involved in cell wall biosynthesis